ncbi:MAG: acetyl-CoA acetyltransferase [Bacillota bacterium]|nr:acetyl-CoA acetyltransferase [Bacillota bacterium]
MRVAIVGVGATPLRPLSTCVSFRELVYEAAVRAYEDAGIAPKDVDTFVAVSEDYWEGTAIFDEYVPDQLGAVLKPVHTICADGITALGAAVMQLQTGRFRVAVVEGHAKPSNVLYPSHIEAFALDPVFVRPLGLNPRFVAGLGMRRFLAERDYTELDCARVVAQNRRHALDNPWAAHPATVEPEDVLASEPLAEPLKELDVSPYADGAVVLVLATEEVARELRDDPVFIRGIGWAQDTPDLSQRDWGRAVYCELAAARAYRMAGIRDPVRELDLAEVDDTFSYTELQHLEALGLARPGDAAAMLQEGFFSRGGQLPVNPSGGNLGAGYLLDASGLRQVAEVVWQLRGEAGARQVPGAEVGLAQSWRGIPTAAGAVAVLAR